MSRIKFLKNSSMKISIIWNKNNPHFSYYWGKFTNCLVKKGRKSFILLTLIKAAFQLKKYTKTPIYFFFESLEVAKPTFLLKWERHGENFFQGPSLKNRFVLYKTGIKWLAVACFRSIKKGLTTKIYTELFNTCIKRQSNIKNDVLKIYTND